MGKSLQSFKTGAQVSGGTVNRGILLQSLICVTPRDKDMDTGRTLRFSDYIYHLWGEERVGSREIHKIIAQGLSNSS